MKIALLIYWRNKMKRSELILRLRLDFNNYIKDNYIKDKYERCGSTENLHLHQGIET